MSDKIIQVDLGDERIQEIAEILSNKTCKKILELLAEKEMSESDISTALNLPLNTVGYNINKLVSAGLVEKTKSFFWSVKGKKIPTYRVANRKIVIYPKRSIKGIVPTVLISALLALGVRAFISGKEVSNIDYSGVYGIAAEKSFLASESVQKTGEIVQSSSGVGEVWLWFLLGALCGLIIYISWNHIMNSKVKGGELNGY